MEWLGFGKGFGFSLDDMTNNTWTEAARKASIEARKMSKAAHKSTVLATRKLHATKVWTNQSRIGSQSALDTAKMAAEAEKVGYNIPVSQIHSMAADNHEGAAETHEEAMAGLSEDQAKLHKEAAIAHRKAAESHRAAAKTHSE